MDEIISIDDWKPSPPSTIFRTKSKWRQQMNKGVTDNLIGRDDLIKIQSYIKNGVSDAEIKETFNITHFVLKKIKKNCYNIFGESYVTMSDTKYEILKAELMERFEEFKDDFRIDNNLSDSMFQKLFMDGMGLLKKRNKKKKLEGEVLQVSDEVDEIEEIVGDDDAEFSYKAIEIEPTAEELRSVEIEEISHAID